MDVLPTEEALRLCRERFSSILDRYHVSEEDRRALNQIDLEYFQLKTELIAKIDHLMTLLAATPDRVGYAPPPVVDYQSSSERRSVR